MRSWLLTSYLLSYSWHYGCPNIDGSNFHFTALFLITPLPLSLKSAVLSLWKPKLCTGLADWFSFSALLAYLYSHLPPHSTPFLLSSSFFTRIFPWPHGNSFPFHSSHNSPFFGSQHRHPQCQGSHPHGGAFLQGLLVEVAGGLSFDPHILAPPHLPPSEPRKTFPQHSIDVPSVTTQTADLCSRIAHSGWTVTFLFKMFPPPSGANSEWLTSPTNTLSATLFSASAWSLCF